jgi:hypothetical protein
MQKGECKLISSNLNNLHFSSLKKELAKSPVEDAIIDGEIVCLEMPRALASSINCSVAKPSASFVLSTCYG